MATFYSQRRKQSDMPDTAPRTPSVVMFPGWWVMYNPSVAGTITNLTNPYAQVVGLNLQLIQSTDPNYATSGLQIGYDAVTNTTDRWLMPVSNGTAISSMIGSVFSVDITTPAPGGLDVTSYSTISYDDASGVFTLGETVTGGTSAATGVVTYVGASPSGAIQVKTVSGTFIAGETITGGTSSHTAHVNFYTVGGVQFRITQVIPQSNPSEAQFVEVEVVKTA